MSDPTATLRSVVNRDAQLSRGKCMKKSGGLIRSVVSVVGAVAILATLAVAVGILAGWIPSNPFREERIDRTGPSVLKSLTDLSEYHAASAHYETVVDLEENTKYIPNLVKGERVLYVGKGDVDAIVDFGELDAKRVSLSADNLSVAIRLPAPTADKPVLDLEDSYVANHDKGFFTKFAGSDLERTAQLKAVKQMTKASAGESTLIDLAKTNTSAMLRGLFGALRFTNVTITYDAGVR